MTKHRNGREPITLATSIQSVELRELTEADSVAFLALVVRNRKHLTRYGDYEDLVKSTLADIDEAFSVRSDKALHMGIWRNEVLMGRVDVGEAAPGAYVLGYWLGEEYTGRGYTTVACKAIMDYARQTRTVKEFWAGVRHVNTESIAVVERLGFSVYEELPDRKRYRLIAPQIGSKS